MAEESHYDVLGVSDDASPEAISQAYRRLVRQVHPDTGGTSPLFRRVQEAYDTLSSPDRRAAYDFDRHRPRATSSTGSGESSGDDGWVRVDQPTDEDPTEGDPSSRRWNDQDPWPGAPGARGRPEGPAPRGTGPHVDPARSSQRGDVLGEPSAGSTGFFGRHPWLWLLAGGVVLFHLAPAVGLLLVFVGFVAALGDMRVHRRHERQWAPDSQLATMDTYQFENYVAELIRSTGAQVRQVRAPGHLGADLLVVRGGWQLVAQARQAWSPVGAEAVQQAAAATKPYKAQRAMVVTNAVFTPEARRLAHSAGVILWDGATLADLGGRPGAAVDEDGAFSRLGEQLTAGAGLLAVVAGIAGAVALASTLASRHDRGHKKR